MHRKILMFLVIVLLMLSCDISDNGTFVSVRTGSWYTPLGSDFDPFSTNNSSANLVMYVSVNISQMDTTVDSPIPNINIDAVEYTPCTIIVSNTHNGLTHNVTDTLIRYKGNTTFNKPKRQFRIKFSADNMFYGYRRINLHSEWKDATLMREKLVYDFMRFAGVIAPRANHVRVFIDNNGDGSGYVYYGLYTLIEAIDTDFLKKHLSSSDFSGNLYKSYYGVRGGNGSGFANLMVIGTGTAADYRGGNGFAKNVNARAYRLRSNEALYMEDYSDISSLINIINNPATGSAYKTLLENAMDVEGFLNWLAVNTLVGGWDNYWMNQQNYYLYNSGNSGYWHWIAWDYDNSLGNNFQDHNGFYIQTEDIYYTGHANNVLIQKVLDVSEWKSYYTNRLTELITTYFNVADMNIRINNLKSDIQIYALDDNYKQYTDSEWANNIESTIITYSDEDGDFGNQAHHLGIKDYIAQRVASVQSQLGIGGGFLHNYPQIYIRGDVSSGGWGSGDAMTLVADYTWQITKSGLTGTSAYKYTESATDWAQDDWGDETGDGTADLESSVNITTSLIGTVTFTFNESTLIYSASN